MAYVMYLDGMAMPVTPSALGIAIKNQNKTVNLISDGEVNILKETGLSDITFSVLLPNVLYPFAVYESGFLPAKTYLDKFESLKLAKKPFQFIVTRAFPQGDQLFHTNIKVSLESYTTQESTDNGFDIVVEMKLKEYKEYGTKVCTIETSATGNTISVETVRETTTSPMPTTAQQYTVVSGDTLWGIAKHFYGNGSQYSVIFEANSGTVANANLIYPGQVLTIPSL